jgi:CheY-like chemotaxis protein
MMSEEKRLPRILCVDDHKELCEELRAMLAGLPARVDVAYDGDGAIDRLLDLTVTRDPYDLVILDMRVPVVWGQGVDPKLGLTLLTDVPRYYQLLRLGTPVIVFTQYPSYSNCVLCMKAGAFDYIHKAEDPETGELGVRVLYRRCKEILYPEKPATDPLRDWLDVHLAELAERYGGKMVALVEGRLAEDAGVVGESVGRFVLISGETYLNFRRFSDGF